MFIYFNFFLPRTRSKEAIPFQGVSMTVGEPIRYCADVFLNDTNAKKGVRGRRKTCRTQKVMEEKLR